MDIFGLIYMELEEGEEEVNKLDALLLCCKKKKVEDIVSRRSKGISFLWKR